MFLAEDSVCSNFRDQFLIFGAFVRGCSFDFQSLAQNVEAIQLSNQHPKFEGAYSVASKADVIYYYTDYHTALDFCQLKKAHLGNSNHSFAFLI